VKETEYFYGWEKEDYELNLKGFLKSLKNYFGVLFTEKLISGV
jgi:hypothetical protein